MTPRAEVMIVKASQCAFAIAMLLLSGCVIGPFDLQLETAYLVDRRQFPGHRLPQKMLEEYPIGIAVEMSSSFQFFGKNGYLDMSVFCDEKPTAARFGYDFYHLADTNGTENLDHRYHYITVLNTIEHLPNEPGHSYYDLRTDNRDICIFVTAFSELFVRSNTIRITHAEILRALNGPVRSISLSKQQ